MTRQPETLEWYDDRTSTRHRIDESGHLFHWTATTKGSKGEDIVSDFGLVPGGVYVAVLNLVRCVELEFGPSKERVKELRERWDDKQSDGTDDRGEEYELLLSDPSASSVYHGEDMIGDDTSLEELEEENREEQDDYVVQKLSSRAQDLRYSISNPETLSRKLRESLIDIVGPEAAVTYHIGAEFDGKDIQFQIARLSPSMVIKLKSDLKTSELGVAYIRNVNGWRVAVGIAASMESHDHTIAGMMPPNGSKISGSFSVTVSR